MKNYNHLIHVRIDKYLNIILIVGAIIAFTGSILLYIVDNLLIYSLLNLIVGTVLLTTFLMAKRIKTSNKIILLIITITIVAIASYIGASFYSAFMTLFLLANVIAVLFLELKTSIITTILFMILFFFLGYYTIVMEGTANKTYQMVSWALQYSAYILFIATIHISAYVIKKYLIDNIEDLEKAVNETNKLAYYEQVTKLPNLSKFKQEVEKIIEKYETNGFIFIFRLKSLSLISSTMGYEMGDKTLIEAAKLFKTFLGKQSIVAKTGGNEFSIWVNHLTEEECFAKFLEISHNLENEINFLKRKMAFNAVFTKLTYGQETFSECYQKALLTLTYAINNNIDELLLYNEKLGLRFRRDEKIKDLLEKAILNQEITLHYQGKFDLRSNQMVGLEALARWSSPELGDVSPSEFIPFVESMNLAIIFGNFVIEQVCKDFKKLQEKYNWDIGVSINISPSHIIDPDIINTISKFLDKYNIPAEKITIEITESIAIQGIKEVNPILKALRNKNLKISLDDFGTGYSSLNYLSQLEIDELKIDKLFIDQIEKNDRINILIENVLHLSEKLNLTVIAEGVETKKQSDILYKLGCYIIQGYYYSKPEKL